MEDSQIKRNEYTLSIVLIILSTVFWGISFISTKIILFVLPPISIAFFRQAIASIFLVFLVTLNKRSHKMNIRDLGMITIASLTGVVLYFIFENNGLRFTTTSNASMIVSTAPIFTLIVEVIFLKLSTSIKTIFYITLSLLGVYIIISVNGKIDFSSSKFIGNILMLGAIACWSTYTILLKKLNKKYSSIIIITYQSVISSILFIPFVIPEIPQWQNVQVSSLLNLLYLGICCSAVAYFFYGYAVARLGTVVSTSFMNLVPVITVIAGCIVLHERVKLIEFIGMILIVFSLFKLNNTKHQELIPK